MQATVNADEDDEETVDGDAESKDSDPTNTPRGALLIVSRLKSNFFPHMSRLDRISLSQNIPGSPLEASELLLTLFTDVQHK
jgi:hypothetical protein